MRIFDIVSTFILLHICFVTALSVIQVSDKNYSTVVRNDEKYSMIKFYADWCRHCKKLHPIFDEVAEKFKYKDNIQFLSINGDKGGKKLSYVFNIMGYPTMVLMQGDGNPVEYQGSRDADSIANFIQLLTNIRLQEKEEFTTSEDDSDNSKVVLMDYGAYSRAVLENKSMLMALVSRESRSYIDAFWQILANSIYGDEDKVIFAQVLIDEAASKKLVDELGKFEDITVLYLDSLTFDKNGKALPKVFGGERSLEDLVAFVNSHAGLHRGLEGELLPSAGKVIFLDRIVGSQKEHPENVGPAVFSAINEFEKFNDPTIIRKDSSMVPYYKKIATRILDNDKDYISREAERLSKLVTDYSKDIHHKAIKYAIMRLNVLATFRRVLK